MLSIPAAFTLLGSTLFTPILAYGSAIAIPLRNSFVAQGLTSLKEGMLVSGSGPNIYLVVSGSRRLFPNENTFQSMGFKPEDIQHVSDLQLQSIPESSPLPAYQTAFREGTLLKGSKPEVYIINAGHRRLIPDETTFKTLGFKWESIQRISDSELNDIPELPLISSVDKLTLKDGTLLKGNGPAIYVINASRRRLIPNERTFNTLGYKWENVRRISDVQLNAIPELPPLPAY